MFLVALVGIKNPQETGAPDFSWGGIGIVDCELHWGQLVAGQLFREGSKCPFPEADYYREDSPFSHPGCALWGWGRGQLLGYFRVRIPSPSVSGA